MELSVNEHGNGPARTLLAMPLASLVTVGLLIMMYSLVATDFVESSEPAVRIDWSAFEPSRELEPPRAKK